MDGRWLARLVVRRVVWIVVGLAVFAVLGALNVSAADPSPDPSLLPTAVALVDVDRARLDGLMTVIVYGVGLLTFLLTAIAVTTGLRRT
jgi:hypothetical protein